MSETLTALDATFLELEEANEGALMAIGGVMVFDPLPEGGVPSLEEVCYAVARRLDALPRYSQKLSSTKVGRFAWPRWVPDEAFEIANHVSRAALPAPGGSAELCDWMADYFSHRLDRTRPLWEIVLIEGLEGGRWALAQKTHHCLIDGVGSVNVLQLLLDAEPDPSEAEPDIPISAPPGGLLQEALPRLPQPLSQAAEAGLHAAEAGAHALRHPREAASRTASLTELLVRDELIAAPHTSLNRPIGSTRRFAAVRLPLGELAAIRREVGGSVNDILLAACSSGLRKLLLERGENPPPQGLRAMVPMDLREASQRLALGNRVTSLFVELPVAESAPEERYRQVVAATTRLKRSGAAAGASTMLDLAALAPPVLHAQLARSIYGTRLFNVTITNVPGPQTPLYAFGAQLREVYPVVPLAAGHTVGIAAFSYNGFVTLGVIADADSTPDIATLAYGVEEGIEELLALRTTPSGLSADPSHAGSRSR
ncbi:MAG TPA: wax ester/triacylglycerol synthase family O-acyltransferase [Solirubrobacteraceae bacterium]|nr:wax ester/triacylglycerol synthase family O-acyltransferase [Solirubrobacteraceae bacterium]